MEYSESPFKITLGSVKEVFKRIEGGDYELADTTSGEVNVFRKAAKNKRALVDTSNYVKFYKAVLDIVPTLSPSGAQLFYYIVRYLKPHRDDITLESSIVCFACGGFSDKTFRRSLNELLEKNIIARKKGSSIEFFVNINYVFNGSRLKLRG
jgi:Fic family protein